MRISRGLMSQAWYFAVLVIVAGGEFSSIVAVVNCVSHQLRPDDL